MADIIALLYILFTLYTSGIGTSEPVFVQKILTDIQVNGVEATIDRLENDLPSVFAEAGIEIPVEIPLEGSHKQSINPETLDYEKELKNLGYYKDESKDVKLNLRNAILRFQSNCNITVDGIWGKKSLKALVLHLGSQNGFCEDLIDTPPSAGKWLVINKSKRILTLYENKIILKKYPVAIGNPPSLTPDGKFTIVSKVINPAWGGGGYAKPIKGGIPANPLGYRWLGLSYKSGDDLGVHGNNSPYSIGKNISHGCIRMINSDVEELFEIVPRSANVWIGTESKLKEWGIVQKEYATVEASINDTEKN